MSEPNVELLAIQLFSAYTAEAPHPHGQHHLPPHHRVAASWEELGESGRARWRAVARRAIEASGDWKITMEFPVLLKFDAPITLSELRLLSPEALAQRFTASILERLRSAMGLK